MSRDLLADLAGYKSYRDKGVVMAARSLIQLYRTVRPELLQRKDRVGGAGGGASNPCFLVVNIIISMWYEIQISFEVYTCTVATVATYVL